MRNGVRFTERASSALRSARDAAASLGHGYVGTEHILIAILQDETCYAMRFLRLLGVDPERVVGELTALLRNTSMPGAPEPATDTTARVSRAMSSPSESSTRAARPSVSAATPSSRCSVPT